MNKLRPYMGMIASMLGMSKLPSTPLPYHLPFLTRKESDYVGKSRRTSRTRINRAAWKCKEHGTPKHLYDIIQSYSNQNGNFAKARCRRCGKVDTIKVHYPEREAAAA